MKHKLKIFSKLPLIALCLMSAIGAYTPVLADSESQVTVCILDSGCNMENITGWNYLEGSDNLSDNMEQASVKSCWKRHWMQIWSC